MKRKTRTLNEVWQSDSLMTVNEVARTLAVSVPTVYLLARDGRLPSVKVTDIGLRFDPVEVADYVDSRRQRGAG
jgi:excisionase family DNA binding protein